MKDFIKEMNIIDFLGIGVPGCTLLLLLTGDVSVQGLWIGIFGTTSNALVQAVFLIVGGFIAGMLIQEIGDFIEKGLWSCRNLDPKTYAARSVGVNRLVKELEGQDAETKPLGYDPGKYFFGVLGAGVVLYGALALLVPAISVACMLQNNSDVELALQSVGGELMLPFGLMICSGVICALCYTWGIGKEAEKLDIIRFSNPYIQTHLVDRGNASRRTLYDGFRFVMRNLVIVLSIVNVVSLWQPIGLYQKLAVKLCADPNALPENLCYLAWLVCAVVFVMLVRWFHYAMLRYKYCFEDFLLLQEIERKKEKQAEDENKQKADQIRIVVSGSVATRK